MSRFSDGGNDINENYNKTVIKQNNSLQSLKVFNYADLPKSILSRTIK